MTEYMLHFLITMVTELPFPAFQDPTKRAEAMLRREIVHKLVGGTAAYSELQECMVSEALKINFLSNFLLYINFISGNDSRVRKG